MKNVLVNAAGEVGANNIGLAAKTGQINTAQQLALHAGLGCAMAAAGSNNCGAGAAAGVVGEALGSTLDKNTNLSNENIIAASQISGALTAAMVVGADDGDSVFAGGNVARNATQNNAIYIGGEVKIPGSDFLTGKGNDYDLNSGLNIGKGLEQKSIGTDGNSSAFYVIPTFGIGGYINFIPHGENINKVFSLGYKNFISADYLTTHQNNSGYGVSLGISTSPITWIPANITIDNSNQSNFKK